MASNIFLLRKTVSNNTRPREREIISHQTGSSEHHGLRNAEMGWNMWASSPGGYPSTKITTFILTNKKNLGSQKGDGFFQTLKKPINLQKPPRQFTCSPPTWMSFWTEVRMESMVIGSMGYKL